MLNKGCVEKKYNAAPLATNSGAGYNPDCQEVAACRIAY